MQGSQVVFNFEQYTVRNLNEPTLHIYILTFLHTWLLLLSQDIYTYLKRSYILYVYNYLPSLINNFKIFTSLLFFTNTTQQYLFNILILIRMRQIDQNAAENVNRILIGNKSDVDPSERVRTCTYIHKTRFINKYIQVSHEAMLR